MGYWTYTYAPVQERKAGTESMRYDGEKPIYLALPDRTFKRETHYEGYGIINGEDVLELVVDWNMGTNEAIRIMDSHVREAFKEREELLEKLAEAKDDPENKYRQRRLDWLDREIPQLKTMRYYLEGMVSLPRDIEKRDVGIQLATYDEDMARLKFPIKFVKNTEIPYDKILGFSAHVQE